MKKLVIESLNEALNDELTYPIVDGIDFLEKWQIIQKNSPIQGFITVEIIGDKMTQWHHFIMTEFLKVNPKLFVYHFWNTPHQYIYTCAINGKPQSFSS